MGVQVLFDNLESVTGVRADALSGFAETLKNRGWNEGELALLASLDRDVRFFLRDVAKTFMDLDDFVNSEPFAEAGRRLDEARETLYRVNALAFAKSARQ